MAPRDAKVICPCCDSLLEVDTTTGQVIRWRKKTELDKHGKPVIRESDWADAEKRALGRKANALDKFDAGLKREKKRDTELDDLFKSSNEKLKEKGDELG